MREPPPTASSSSPHLVIHSRAPHPQRRQQSPSPSSLRSSGLTNAFRSNRRPPTPERRFMMEESNYHPHHDSVDSHDIIGRMEHQQTHGSMEHPIVLVEQEQRDDIVIKTISTSSSSSPSSLNRNSRKRHGGIWSKIMFFGNQSSNNNQLPKSPSAAVSPRYRQATAQNKSDKGVFSNPNSTKTSTPRSKAKQQQQWWQPLPSESSAEFVVPKVHKQPSSPWWKRSHNKNQFRSEFEDDDSSGVDVDQQDEDFSSSSEQAIVPPPKTTTPSSTNTTWFEARSQILTFDANANNIAREGYIEEDKLASSSSYQMRRGKISSGDSSSVLSTIPTSTMTKKPNQVRSIQNSRRVLTNQPRGFVEADSSSWLERDRKDGTGTAYDEIMDEQDQVSAVTTPSFLSNRTGETFNDDHEDENIHEPTAMKMQMSVPTTEKHSDPFVDPFFQPHGDFQSVVGNVNLDKHLIIPARIKPSTSGFSPSTVNTDDGDPTTEKAIGRSRSSTRPSKKKIQIMQQAKKKQWEREKQQQVQNEEVGMIPQDNPLSSSAYSVEKQTESIHKLEMPDEEEERHNQQEIQLKTLSLPRRRLSASGKRASLMSRSSLIQQQEHEEINREFCTDSIPTAAQPRHQELRIVGLVPESTNNKNEKGRSNFSLQGSIVPNLHVAPKKQTRYPSPSLLAPTASSVAKTTPRSSQQQHNIQRKDFLDQQQFRSANTKNRQTVAVSPNKNQINAQFSQETLLRSQQANRNRLNQGNLSNKTSKKSKASEQMAQTRAANELRPTTSKLANPNTAAPPYVDSSDPMQVAGYRLLSAAVLPIQSAARRYIALQRALTRMWAIVIIQSWTRRYLTKKHYANARSATTMIQKIWRGVSVRDRIVLEHCCAIELQRHARGWLALRYATKRMQSVLILQSSWRRRVALNTATERMVAVMEIQAFARMTIKRRSFLRLRQLAIHLQTAWRVFAARCNYQLDLLDIILVQSCIRRKIATSRVTTIRKERQIRASIKIQSAWRSYDCSMNYLSFLADVLIAQSVARRWIAIRRCRALRNEAATVIQTRTRGLLGRLVLSRIRSAILLQRIWRGHSRRVVFVLTISDVVLIQSIVRCWIQKKKYPILLFTRCTEAAIMIQKHWRGFAQATEYFIMLYERRSAIAIQSRWRCANASANFGKIRSATTFIQAIFRGFLDRKNFKHKLIRTCIIQKAWRCFAMKKSLEFMVQVRQMTEIATKQESILDTKSATLIQAIVRAFQAQTLVHCFVSARVIQAKWRVYSTRRAYVRYIMARKIQSHWRRFVLRADFIVYVMARSIQAAWRGYVARADFGLFIVARKIQNAWRGYKARTTASRHRAARRIQATWRGYVLRVSVSYYLRARSIQAVWRGYVVRQPYIEYKAARQIQMAWRCRSAKNTLNQLMKARSIQATWRRYSAHRNYKEYKAARCIQSQWRCFYQCNVFKYYINARRIQTSWRYHHAHNKFHEYMAARCIQTQWRCFFQRSVFHYYICARRIQTFWRWRSVEKPYKQYVNARRIQKIWRGSSARCAFHRTKASRQIQSIWRRKLVRTAYLEYLSARRIQTLWRCKLVRTAYLEYLSARRIQTSWRRKIVRTAYLEYAAARRIQAIWRGKLVKRIYLYYIAARRIQAIWRGKYTRKAYVETISARKIQSAWRTQHCRRSYLKHIAARTIQAVWRGRFLREAYVQYIAARQIQAKWRSKLLRKAYLEYLAARTIQKMWRGKVIRNACKIIGAAICIQSFWRGTSQRAAYDSYKERQAICHKSCSAILSIQTTWRRKLAREAFQRVIETVKREAACRIQSAWRGHYIHELFKHYVAARRIQAWLRMKFWRKSYMQFVSARRIQSFQRGRSCRRPYLQYIAARRIQTYWREKSHAKDYKHYVECRAHRYLVLNAAVCIQKHWRRVQTRKALLEYLEHRTIYSVCRIQAFWRGKLLRQAYRQYISARQIQATWRGKVDRRPYIQFIAARRIQAFWRGKSLQKAYVQFLAARCIQSLWRRKVCESQYKAYKVYYCESHAYQSSKTNKSLYRRDESLKHSNKELFLANQAAIRIQCLFRRVKARKRLRKRLAKQIRRHREHTLAAVAIQRLFRGHICRQASSDYWKRMIDMRKCDRAAVTIQRVWRGFECQQNYWQMLGFTIRLQAIVRGWIAKRKVTLLVDDILKQRMRNQIERSTIIMQRAVRLWIFKHERSHAATTINRFLLRKLHRKRFLCIVGTAVIIQRTFRRWLMFREECVRHNAARTIQRFFLMVKAEVDREILRRKHRRRSSRKNRRNKIDPEKEAMENKLLEEAWDHLTAEENNKINKQRMTSGKMQWAVEATLQITPTAESIHSHSVKLVRRRGGSANKRTKEGRDTPPNTRMTMAPHHPRHVKSSLPPSSPRFLSLSKREINTDLMLEEAWIDADIRERKERRQVATTIPSHHHYSLPPYNNTSGHHHHPQQMPSPSSSRFLLPSMTTTGNSRSHQTNPYHVL